MEQYPKSKFILQKRSLERRKVFMEHLERLEMFMELKQKKMERITTKRLIFEAKLAKKNISRVNSNNNSPIEEEVSV
jgi:hypothetical protein